MVMVTLVITRSIFFFTFFYRKCWEIHKKCVTREKIGIEVEFVQFLGKNGFSSDHDVHTWENPLKTASRTLSGSHSKLLLGFFSKKSLTRQHSPANSRHFQACSKHHLLLTFKATSSKHLLNFYQKYILFIHLLY